MRNEDFFIEIVRSVFDDIFWFLLFGQCGRRDSGDNFGRAGLLLVQWMRAHIGGYDYGLLGHERLPEFVYCSGECRLHTDKC